MRILAISGSLRLLSSNTALLRTAELLAPPNVEISFYEGLSSLPLFNPDSENREFPSVSDFRAQIRASNGILIASPEYAHGIPGAMKNALDWIVGSGELVDKPVALLNASSRATHAYESLKEVIKMMNAHIIAEASVIIPLPHNEIDQASIIAHVELSGLLRKALVSFAYAIETQLHKSLSRN